jgi:two-component system, OmpR family, response regulator MprA
VKILLVSDDLDELDVTAYMLRREQFAVVHASDTTGALRRFRLERPDLVVIDIATARGGIDTLRQIRSDGQTPVLVIAGRGDREELFRYFELGADDFVTKPYVLRELALRIRAILRRAGRATLSDPESAIEVGDLRLDPKTQEVRCGARDIRLTPTEFRILYRLAKNAEHVVPADRLRSYVWGHHGGAANSLRSHICHLRKKLMLDGTPSGSIASIPAVGYVLRSTARAGATGSTRPPQSAVAAS